MLQDTDNVSPELKAHTSASLTDADDRFSWSSKNFKVGAGNNHGHDGWFGRRRLIEIASNHGSYSDVEVSNFSI